MYENLIASLESVQANADARGFNAPTLVYWLTGEKDDPTFTLMGEMPPGVDVVACLRAGWDKGMRVMPSVHGLGLVSEGWRNLDFDEVVERAPDVVAKLRYRIADETGKEVTHEDLKNAYENDVRPNLGDPNNLPDEMRAEVRVSYAILRNGDCVAIGHSRDMNDHQRDLVTRDKIREMPAAAASYMFLHGLRPEDVDPVQAVDDYQAIQAMAGEGEKKDNPMLQFLGELLGPNAKIVDLGSLDDLREIFGQDKKDDEKKDGEE